MNITGSMGRQFSKATFLSACDHADWPPQAANQ
jgi:hypothetical protein